MSSPFNAKEATREQLIEKCERQRDTLAMEYKAHKRTLDMYYDLCHRLEGAQIVLRDLNTALNGNTEAT